MRGSRTFRGTLPFTGDLQQNAIDSLQTGGNERALSPERAESPKQRESVYSSMNTLYSTADVDPLVTGQLYEFRDNTRDVYANRTSDWGLHEFAPDTIPGGVGVDIGPNALAEYEGSSLGFNDGIPEQWAFPSTPIRDYVPKHADYTDKDGTPTIVDGDALYELWVPDHDPLVGEEDGPF
jgi:hypothetical protein